MFYAWQAYQLAKRSGRTDVCALPYGINTVSLIGYVFLIMLPAKLVAMNRGATLLEAEQVALGAGVVAAMGSGLFEAGVPSRWQKSGAGRHARPCCPRSLGSR
jgi:AGZA family xanthine/uracil permease-like MFS transporter